MVPITFVIHSVDAGGSESDWVGITEHGVLYGRAPEVTSAQTFRVDVCATDPARNTLRFHAVLLVLPGDPPEEETVGAQLDTPTGLTASRYPQAWSPLLFIQMDRVAGADRYQFRHRNDGGSDEAGWTVVDEPISEDLLELPGSDHVVQARALSDDSSITASDWTASVDAEDQAGRPVSLPTLTVTRGDENLHEDVTLMADALPTGVTQLQAERRQSGGAWTDVDFEEGETEVTITLGGSEDAATEGTGWEVRWKAAGFTVEDGYADNEAGSIVAVPDQQKLPYPADFAAARVPDNDDDTVRFTYGQVEHADTYRILIEQNGTEDASKTQNPSRTTTSVDVELDGSGWTATIQARAAASSGYLHSEVSPELQIEDERPDGPLAFASDATANRPNDHEQEVRVAWTPSDEATAQAILARQGSDAFAAVTTDPAAITPTTIRSHAEPSGNGMAGVDPKHRRPESDAGRRRSGDGAGSVPARTLAPLPPGQREPDIRRMGARQPAELGAGEHAAGAADAALGGIGHGACPFRDGVAGDSVRGDGF